MGKKEVVHGLDKDFLKFLAEGVEAVAESSDFGKPKKEIVDPLRPTAAAKHSHSLVRKLFVGGATFATGLALLYCASQGYDEATDIDGMAYYTLTPTDAGASVSLEAPEDSEGLLRHYMGAATGGILALIGQGDHPLPDTTARFPADVAGGVPAYSIYDGNACAPVDVLSPTGEVVLSEAMLACVLHATATNNQVDEILAQVVIPNLAATQAAMDQLYAAQKPEHTIEGDGGHIADYLFNLIADEASGTCAQMAQALTAAGRFDAGIDTTRDQALPATSLQPDHLPSIGLLDSQGDPLGWSFPCTSK